MARIGIRLARGEWFFDDARRLGRPGGFGDVFEGEDSNGTPVAVKRLRLTAADAAHRELAVAEELAGRVFRHVLAPLDSGQDADSGFYFVVMPRAERSLADEISARGPLPANEANTVLQQIARGLQELPGLIHRDLKPANVLLHDGVWKIADFGIARFVEDATSLNTLRECLTPAFAAPEQWNAEHATGATDIYAWGCVAHVLFQGEPPFPGPTSADYRRQHLGEHPPALAAAEPRVRALVSGALRKPQAGRPGLNRVIAVLTEVIQNPAAPRPALGELQRANAAEVQRVSEREAAAARERQQQRERNALIENAQQVLRQIAQEFEAVARANEPDANIVASAASLIIRMGDSATLEFRASEATPPNVTFPNSGWEVRAIARIRVDQIGRNEWKHGATLWYARIRGAGELRWYEVSYKRSALVRGPLIGPFAIQDLGNDIYREADLAAGPGMHTIEVEFGPAPIDDEAINNFIERWLARLAQAYNGRLRPF